MRRSTRSGLAESKAKASRMIEYLRAPDHKVLSGALPPPSEQVTPREFNMRKDRLKPQRRVALGLQRPQRKTALFPHEIGSGRRHILFLNIGDERILEAIVALSRNQEPPPWMRYLKGITAENGKLYHEEGGRRLPFAFADDKRKAVKDLYFNPKEPATIQPITDALRHKFCNISRNNVRNILRSLETYQLMFPRRKHPAIQHHTNYTKPGVIAMDTFFPTGNSGWVERTGGVLVCMDVWSRFSRAYALETKDAEMFEQAMKAFFAEFTSLGHLPRRLLTDKGSELHVGTPLIEKYRLPRDGDAPMHLRSFTGTPVQVVENMNAQYQRRLEVYRISELHDDPADLLWDISEQLNNQKRARRGNLTPYQLLDLSDRDRNAINKQYEGDYYGVGVQAQKKLPYLNIGAHVRRLEMTFKEQQKGSRKGFQEKWSREVFQVLRRVALRRNRHVYRYSIGDPDRTYYRHELLLIPKEIDQEVVRFPTSAPLLVEETWLP